MKEVQEILHQLLKIIDDSIIYSTIILRPLIIAIALYKKRTGITGIKLAKFYAEAKLRSHTLPMLYNRK